MCDANVVDLIVNAVLICYKGVVNSGLNTSKERSQTICLCRRQYASVVYYRSNANYISGKRRIHQVKSKQREQNTKYMDTWNIELFIVKFFSLF